MASRSVLVVDDEKNMRQLLADVFGREGYDVELVESGEEALARLAADSYGVVLLDLGMEGIGGLEVMRRLRAQGQATPIIVITAYGSIDAAVEAMKLGAFDFIVKPFGTDRILQAVESCFQSVGLLNGLDRSRPSVAPTQAGDGAAMGMVGTSKELADIRATIAKVSTSDAAVLIRGESGTGKELVARAIHINGSRRQGPFVPINCASLPETLLESELFGYERGAFTGAYSKKPGLLELADRGSLFLDEIGDMSPLVQAKLLRAIQEKEFTSVGGSVPHKVDIRFIAATNKDLERAVADGRFRQDLFFRLNVICVSLPPLRERRGDIRPLVEFFIHKYAGARGAAGFRLPEATLKAMETYDWPGNIRELEHFVERAIVLGRELAPPVRPDALRTPLLDPAPAVPGANPAAAAAATAAAAPAGAVPAAPDAPLLSMQEATRRAQREAILAALRSTAGNKLRAAALLGITAKTLYNKIEELGISVSRTFE